MPARRASVCSFASTAVAAITMGCGGAAADEIAWDNGPIITGTSFLCQVPLSLCQNVTMGLNNCGYTCGPTPSVAFLADDFTLDACTDLTTIELSLYQFSLPAPPAPSITSVTLRLHAGPTPPEFPTSNVLQTLTTPVVATFANIVREPQDVDCCFCRIQTVIVDVSAWSDLPPGQYWLAWTAVASNSSGIACPPVTILGACGKEGANALRATTGPYVPVTDNGGLPGCEAAPQDFPFIIRGNVGRCICPANIVLTGTSAARVDIDDLVAVINQWGVCPGCPPATCPADVAPFPTGDCLINVDDLVAVILNWGPCP